MSEEGANVILFTGQSGIKVGECLKRLNKQLDPRAEIISIEKTMVEISDRSFLRIIEDDILSQYGLWQKALGEILRGLNDFGTVFLTLHGVYYHQNKREFVSPVDVKMISELQGKVKALIVFIDDIYDVYRRLMDDGEMYNYVIDRLEPSEALYASCFNLISILEWRQIEITISRMIGRILDIPIYIVATKHPAFMVARLINTPIEDLRIFYLSHPISSIRKDAVGQLPNFTGELSLFARRIIDNPQTILFIPDAIDELNIKEEDSQYLPECLGRWELPYGEESWICPPLPERLENIKPLNPQDYDISSHPEIKTSISYLMRLLYDYINVQITSRDLSLVEQSKDGVVAYRPYFPHKLSGGARRELEHNCELSQKEDLRRNIILSVTEDQGKYRIQRLFQLIETFVEDLDSSVRASLQSKRRDWTYDGDVIKVFSDDTLLREKIADIRNAVEKVLPSNYRSQADLLSVLSYQTSLSPGELKKQENERHLVFQYFMDLLLKDKLEDYVILAEDYQKFSSSDEILREIEVLLGKHRKADGTIISGMKRSPKAQ